MEMQPVSSIKVPAGGSVQLKPGSYHIMLIGLTHPLAAGQSFPVTLKFQDAGTVKVQAHVRPMSQ
jgi:periplasmic copper chaperone A